MRYPVSKTEFQPWKKFGISNTLLMLLLQLHSGSIFNSHSHTCMMQVESSKNVWLLKTKLSIYLIVLDKTFFKIADYLTESEHPR